MAILVHDCHDSTSAGGDEHKSVIFGKTSTGGITAKVVYGRSVSGRIRGFVNDENGGDEN